MPKWLNNTWYIIVLIVFMGCVTQNLKWQSYKK